MDKRRAFFIDIDNTLLDFDGYVKESMEKGFKKFGLKKYEPWMYDVFTRENDILWKRHERKEVTFEYIVENRFSIIFKALNIEFDGPTFEKYFREQLNQSAIPVKGSYEMLEELSKDFILCTASNGPYDQQVNRLKIACMDKYFDYFFVSGKIGHQKPSGEFYDYAFSEINGNREVKIKPEDCFAIGDSITSDIAGGYNYHMKTIYYLHHNNIAKDDRVDYYVDNLLDVPNILRKSIKLNDIIENNSEVLERLGDE